MSERYQERENFGLYPLVDILSVVLKEQPSFQLSNEENVAKAEVRTLINNFLALESARKHLVDQLAFTAFAGSKFKEWVLLRKIDKLDKEIKQIESRLEAIELRPELQRLLEFGREFLKKNPHLVEQYNRVKARASQDYQIQLIKTSR